MLHNSFLPLGKYLIIMQRVETGEEEIIQGTSDPNCPFRTFWSFIKAIQEIETPFHAFINSQQAVLLKPKFTTLQGFFPQVCVWLYPQRTG